MTQVDSLLKAIYNPMRREILRAIVEGKTYPLGISRDIGGTQQAVIKHLRVLEEAGVVKRVGEERSSSGPPRVIYGISARMTLTIDLTENVMNVEVSEIECDDACLRKLREMAEREGVAAIDRLISAIERELKDLERRRKELIQMMDAALCVKKGME